VTDSEIAELLALCEAAAPTPWCGTALNAALHAALLALREARRERDKARSACAEFEQEHIQLRQERASLLALAASAQAQAEALSAEGYLTRGQQEEVEALWNLADVVNDAFGGLAIGASVDVVMAPVRRALDALTKGGAR
jgi:hypothetical protein